MTSDEAIRVPDDPPQTGEPQIDDALAEVVHDQSPEALGRALEVLQSVLDDQAGDAHHRG